MPKVDGQRAHPAAAPPGDADATAAADSILVDAWRSAIGAGGLANSLLQQAAKRGSGAAADLGCSCAKCLRKAGPVREDAE